MRSAWAAALLLAACERSVVLDLSVLPPSMRWVALTARSAEGDVVATPLIDVRARSPYLEHVARDATVEIYGWTDAQLPDVAPGAEPLRIAEDCAFRLPPPAVARARRPDGTIADLDPSGSFPLTAAWLTPACPALGEARRPALVRLDDPSAATCAGTIEQRGCDLVVGWRDVRCGGPYERTVVRGVDAVGNTCAGATPDCWVIDAETARFSCDVAGRTVTIDPERYIGAAPPIEVRTATVTSKPPAPPRADTWYPGASESDMLQELVVLDDRVLVFGEGSRCEGEMWTLDLETLAPLGPSKPWARCGTSAIPDPRGSGFIAMWSPSQVARFTRDGTQIGAPVELAAPASFVFEHELLEIGTATRTIAALGISSEVVDRTVVSRTSLDLLDPATLAPRAHEDLGFAAASATRLEDGELVVFDGAEDRARVFRTGASLQPAAEWRVPLVSAHVTVGPIAANGRRLVLPITFGVPAGIYTLRENDFRGTFIAEAGARAVGAITWPADPRLVLVAGLTYSGTEPENAARVLFFDGRAMLRGATRVGTGLITRMRTDRRGRVWLLLPWSGQVARVTSRSA